MAEERTKLWVKVSGDQSEERTKLWVNATGGQSEERTKLWMASPDNVQLLIEGMDEKMRAEVEKLAAEQNKSVEELIAEKLESLPTVDSLDDLDPSDPETPIFEISWT